MTTIYALCDPMTHEIRYVGKTKQNIYSRLSQHVRYTKRYNFYNSNWVRSLRPLKPEILELELIGDDEWVEAEQFWIAYFKTLGAKLTNLTKGGEGTNGVVLSEESKLKISRAAKGNKSWLGKTHTEETKNKLRGNKSGLGYKFSQELKDTCSKKLLKRGHSGISLHSGKYRLRVQFRNNRVVVGNYDTFEEAVVAKKQYMEGLGV